MNKKSKSSQDIVRNLTRNANCVGATVSGWASAAAFLKRCQVHDRKQYTGQWTHFPAGRMGWVTDSARVLGVGYMPPAGDLIGDEVMIPVHLPFEGAGRDLRAHAEKALKRMARAQRKAAK